MSSPDSILYDASARILYVRLARPTWGTRKQVLIIPNLSILACGLKGFLEVCWGTECSFALLQEARHVDPGLVDVDLDGTVHRATDPQDICISDMCSNSAVLS
jgi:hypothetical protein